MSSQTSSQDTEAAGAIVLKPNEHFPFLKLPLEIRRKIYRELLLSEKELYMGDCSIFPCNNGLHLEILLTCQQIHDEAVGVLYGENIFKVIPDLDPDNSNASRIRHAHTQVNRCVVILTEFLDHHPDLTHLLIELTEKAVLTKNILGAIERALKRHRSLVDLEVRVRDPLSPNTIDFCWRLYSAVRRNRAAGGVRVRPEEDDLHDTADWPFFAKCI
jgi:hypothetical protein